MKKLRSLSPYVLGAGAEAPAERGTLGVSDRLKSIVNHRILRGWVKGKLLILMLIITVGRAESLPIVKLTL